MLDVIEDTMNTVHVATCLLLFHIFVDGHDPLGHMKVGLWCLAGLLGFFLLEKVFAEESKDDEEDKNENITSEKEMV